jgi:hypothetical protein
MVGRDSRAWPRLAGDYGSKKDADAICFLDNFCQQDDNLDQSHAALADVLLFPSMGSGQVLVLPAPTASNWKELMPVTLPLATQESNTTNR